MPVRKTATMEITGLGWVGTRTDRSSELAAFYENVLGLRPVHTEPGFWVFALPGGRNAEVFSPDYPGRVTSRPGPSSASPCEIFPQRSMNYRQQASSSSARPDRPGSSSEHQTATSTNS